MPTLPPVSNEFVADTDIVASDMNTNFSELVTFVNTNLISADGAKAMTANLTLNGDPSGDDHAARKKYVDDRLVTSTKVNGAAISSVGPNTIATINITDPGYDIDVWASAQIMASSTSASKIWEFQLRLQNVTITGTRKSLPAGFQTATVLLPMQKKVTGFTTLVVTSVFTTYSGSGTLSTVSDSRFNWLEVWWRKSYP